jgi:hypothetical protein
MIALLLVVQLSGVVPANPGVQAVSAPPARGSEIIKTLPRKAACKSDPARMEVSLAVQPAALYRKGDRPAKGLKNWADYPDATICDVEDAK